VLDAQVSKPEKYLKAIGCAVKAMSLGWAAERRPLSLYDRSLALVPVQQPDTGQRV
jgi:hypothetical protein